MLIQCNFCNDIHLESNLTKINSKTYICDKCNNTVTTCPTCKSNAVTDDFCHVCGDTFAPNYYAREVHTHANKLQLLCNCGEMLISNGTFEVDNDDINVSFECQKCKKIIYKQLKIK